MRSHREQLGELVDEHRVRLGAHIVRRRESEVPPPSLLTSTRARTQPVTGRELTDARERRTRRLVAQSVNAWTIETGSSARVASGWRSSAFASEAKASRPPALGEEQWTDAETIAGEEQLACLAIPHGERELAVEAGEAIHAPFLVGVNDHLRVAVRREAVPESGELALQLGVVEDLPVLHHPEAAALVAQWLVDRPRGR
jgi:hypothetical protein